MLYAELMTFFCKETPILLPCLGRFGKVKRVFVNFLKSTTQTLNVFQPPNNTNYIYG